jgi:hypothetical protein
MKRQFNLLSRHDFMSSETVDCLDILSAKVAIYESMPYHKGRACVPSRTKRTINMPLYYHITPCKEK